MFPRLVLLLRPRPLAWKAEFSWMRTRRQRPEARIETSHARSGTSTGGFSVTAFFARQRRTGRASRRLRAMTCLDRCADGSRAHARWQECEHAPR